MGAYHLPDNQTMILQDYIVKEKSWIINIDGFIKINLNLLLYIVYRETHLPKVK